ncbi:TMAO reductase system periplasmic protein TorT [Motiliproteus coralliicola]|nr:TMAO reductase system periplasmic protein TorT [Motiliproteus coralliicola]
MNRSACHWWHRYRFGLVTIILTVMMASTVQAWTVQSRQPLFQFEQWQQAQIEPISTASRPWRLCALYPHIKDSYWLSVNYGMVDQAQRLGVQLKAAEAGGYHHLERQWQQLQACLDWPADAILLGTVAYQELNSRLQQLDSEVPLFGVVNDLSRDGLTGRVGVSWYQMGFKVGRFLAERHPAGSAPVKVAWFPGPKRLEAKSEVGSGIRDGLAGSAVSEVITAGYGDNDRDVQRALLQQLLDQHQDLDYIVGGAVLVEIAINELKHRQLDKPPQLISHYYSHGMYRALLRGKVLMANTDQMVLHGRLAIDQAVRFLEGQPFERDIGPEIISLTRDRLSPQIKQDSLSPASFMPTYRVEP